jgi:hypothetical protein
MSKASVLTIRVPADLKHRIALVAKEQGVSINQLAMYMFTKEVEDLEAKQSISQYWQKYSKEEILSDFDEVISKVKNRPVPSWDKIQ